LAARLGVGVNTDGIDITADGGTVTVRRPALDDSVHVMCGYSNVGGGSLQGIALFRANSFAPASPNGGQAAVETLDVPDSGRRAASFHGVEHADTSGVDITQADVLVAGGRGLGGPENFHLVESLAKAVGGEVATTRAVVDAGWYDYSTQVGQTGKTVAPKLYFAVGISGAIQHKIGMQNSGTIVAINKDPNAPIFEFADFGVVGDLFQVVPKLEEAIKARKGG
jgi:electron transfer flavoprotein alpha subunit